MEGHFEGRCEELLSQSEVSAADWKGVMSRLATFVSPFVGALVESSQRRHFVEYAAGLLSTLDRKTGEGIAYLFGQDRKQVQQFIGESPWEHSPVLIELSRQVGARIGLRGRRRTLRR